MLLRKPWLLIRAFQNGIESASVLGDRDVLEEYEQRIVVSGQLPEAARTELLKAVTAALKATPETPDDGRRVLRQLTAGCRALTLAEYVAGRTSWLFNNGFYHEINPKVWLESRDTPSSQRRLRETTRNRSFIELYDGGLKRSVRLYNLKAWERRPGDTQWRLITRGSWEDPSLVPLDPMKLPDVRGVVEKTARRDFPYLGQRFEVLGPATRSYNCIAWSLNITDHWVWPGYQIRDFDRLNGQRGFRRIDGLDFTRRVHVDRIVLYGKKNRGRLEATHQARQLADGSWSSKLGALPLIRHLKPEDLNGDIYGTPVAVFVRTRTSGSREVEE